MTQPNKKRKVKKPRDIKYCEGHLHVDFGMAYYRTKCKYGGSDFHKWLGKDVRDLKRAYKWLGQAINYLESKKND